MQKSWLHGTLLVVVALSSTACVGVHGVSAGASPAPSAMLSRRDLAEMDRLNAFEALRRLRPTWLSTRGQAALVAPDRESVRVYVDNLPYGDLVSLKGIPVRSVGSIQHLDGHEATLRYGTGNAEGAILVTTRNGNPEGAP